MIIFGGNNGQYTYGDYIIFDTAMNIIVERKELAGYYQGFQADWRFCLKADQESIIFLSNGDDKKFELCKLYRGKHYVKNLYEILNWVRYYE